MDDLQNNIADSAAFTTDESPASKIKVIGVGGGGCNALNYMFHQDIPYVSFAAVNTDRQHLNKKIDVPTKVLIGKGYGAGDKPEVGRQFAEESEDRIRALFDDETEMVFVTAGMGGGTGTGAAPVIARIAKEEEKLTVGIITIPFLFEGQNKISKALAGAEEMKKYVDAMLIINDQNLLEIYPEKTLMEAFNMADDTLANAARSISEIISEECYINVDMADVKTTLRESGTAIIATAYGEGEHRITDAIQNALHSPLLKAHDIMSAKRVLIKLVHAPDTDTQRPLKAQELGEFTNFTNRLSQGNFEVKWGIGRDPRLGDKVKLTLLATGFDVTINEQAAEGVIRMTADTDDEVPMPRQQTPKDNIAAVYSAESLRNQQRQLAKAKYAVLKPSQFDDDRVIDMLESTPAYNRPSKFNDQLNNCTDTPSSSLSPNASLTSTARQDPAKDDNAGTVKITF
ncbi:MAG: cell division protein FtsZ [Lepagella sp.]